MRRWLILVLALVVGLVAADSALWWVATQRLAVSYMEWRRQTRAAGWQVEASPPVAGGWPVAATLTVSDVRLHGGAAMLPGGLAWSAENVVFGIDWLRPATLFVAPEGTETLRLSGAPPLNFSADTLQARIPLGDAMHRMALSATALVGGIAHSRAPRDVRIDRLEAHLASRDATITGQALAELTIEATGIGLPDTGRWPFGDIVAGAGATASVTLPPLGGGSTSAAVTGWRDHGGEVNVTSVDLRWGPLTLNGSARLRLDGRLQPAGTAQAHLTGQDQALDALAASGTIPAGVAGTAKAVLGLMAGGGTPGSGLDLPLTLRDNTLSVGHIPLVRLNDIHWPA
jgi:hypothetical protein